MDPITASALVAVLVKVLDGASGEAGRQTWTALTGLVRQTFGRRSETAETAGELERNPGDRARVETLAEALAAEARRDPEFADELRDWLADVERPAGGGDIITNNVGGSAKVGNVIQARDISGINIGERD
ncbi:hypothetical protein [Actinomadura sp. HBU206391]|uniref:hypothetical protein n=1 Tax=Actinomadura sp. HBU206391 TaxID=2731692 RepID=UPI0016503B32|nr:hypothetical protein [Actinomadura sp. HBU206391]MBC6457561.1 hypothetical protein [Actinomadura sp. HBU206391]